MVIRTCLDFPNDTLRLFARIGSYPYEVQDHSMLSYRIIVSPTQEKEVCKEEQVFSEDSPVGSTRRAVLSL